MDSKTCSHVLASPQMCTASPITILSRWDVYSNWWPCTDSPSSPTFPVDIWVHCWCCRFYGFGQLANGIDPPLECHTEKFLCTKNPLFSTCSFLFLNPLTLTITHFFLLSPKLYLFQNATELDSYSVLTFWIGFFHLVIRIKCAFKFHAHILSCIQAMLWPWI